MNQTRKCATQARRCLLIALIFCVPLTPISTAGHGPSGGGNPDHTFEFNFDQEQGINVIDTLELSGESRLQLRDTEWDLYDVLDDMNPLMHGDFLTAVFPTADGYSWNLSVNVSGYDCTCIMEISVPNPDGGTHVHPLFVYIGSVNHQPVLLPTNFHHDLRPMVNGNVVDSSEEGATFQTASQSNLPLNTLQDNVVEFGLITPEGDVNGSMIKANICQAPYGVCLDEGETITLLAEFKDNTVSLHLNSSLIDDEEGIWKFAFFAQDDLLRTSPDQNMFFIHDVTPPSLKINMDSSAEELEQLSVFSETVDGYTGAYVQETWTITLPNGSIRAPFADEIIDSSHLILNFSQSGEYTLELSGRDQAGNMNSTMVQFSIINQPPVAVISIDGLTATNNQIVQMSAGGNWTIHGTDSYDNEVIDYLWIIDSSTSIRGVESLSYEDFKSSGTYLIELIVFDDDGSTNSTIIELQIQSGDDAASAGPNMVMLAFVGLVLFGAIGTITYFIFGREETGSLPKWSAANPTDTSSVEVVDEGQNNATIEEA
jgi:hypothetical protein